MYPDLSYLFHDLLGTSPDNWLSIFKTFGFCLALSFLLSALVFNIELRRKAREGFYQPVTVSFTEGLPATAGEMLANAIAGLLIVGKGFYAYQHYSEFRHDPASIILSLKMHWLAGLLGAAALAGITWWDGQRRKKDQPVVVEKQLYPHDRLSELTVLSAISGILGAKLFDLFDNWESFLEDPVGSLASGGGLAFLGGLLLGFAAGVWFLWRHKIPIWPTLDSFAPCIVAGYGFGRVGCQLSGDGDWGIVNTAPKPDWMSFLPDWMWAYRYPHHVLNTPRTDPTPSVPIEGCSWDYCLQLAEPVFPTPFYETLMMCAIFGLIWFLRKRVKTVGMIFFIYLALMAMERFAIEKIRVNVSHNVLGFQLTQAEIISIVLFCVSVGGMVYVSKFRKETA